MFYDKNYFRVYLVPDALDGCKDLRSACRKGFDIYFKILNTLQNVEVYSTKQLRFVKSRQVGERQFSVSFKGAFPYVISTDLEKRTTSVSDLPLSDEILQATSEGNYVPLVQLFLNAFSEMVLAYHNLDVLNTLLERYRPVGSPYTVRFSLNEKVKDRFVSDLREDFIEWCVIADYPQTFQSSFPTDVDALKEFVRKEFYVGFDVLTEVLRGQSTKWSDYLAGRPPTGVTYNPMRLVSALALELEPETDQRCKFLYTLADEDTVVLYKRDENLNGYREILVFDRETGALSDPDKTYILSYNSDTKSMVKVSESVGE